MGRAEAAPERPAGAMKADGGGCVETFAQTNLQLFDQLRRADYGEADLAVVARAHAYARELFTSSYRASGKPFLCHAVGTASVLASLELPAALVAAGVLHAAYPLGVFGDGGLGLSETKRSQVRARVGAVIEDLIHRYTVHPWDADTPARLLARLDRGEEIDRDILLMRLANEIDDHLDLGILYCRDAADRLRRLHHIRQPAIELARRLGHPRLGPALEEVFERCLSAAVPEVLHTTHAVSFAVAPLSRIRWRIRQVLAVLREWMKPH